MNHIQINILIKNKQTCFLFGSIENIIMKYSFYISKIISGTNKRRAKIINRIKIFFFIYFCMLSMIGINYIVFALFIALPFLLLIFDILGQSHTFSLHNRSIVFVFESLFKNDKYRKECMVTLLVCFMSLQCIVYFMHANHLSTCLSIN